MHGKFGQTKEETGTYYHYFAPYYRNTSQFWLAVFLQNNSDIVLCDNCFDNNSLVYKWE
jgi:hypothetical protein